MSVYNQNAESRLALQMYGEDSQINILEHVGFSQYAGKHLTDDTVQTAPISTAIIRVCVLRVRARARACVCVGVCSSNVE